MKLQMLSLFMSSVLTSSELIQEEGVFVLEKSNFDDALENTDFLLVQFHTSSCPHCQALAPEYAAAAAQLADKSSAIKLAKVDLASVENKLVAFQYGVDRVPSIKFFKNGKAINLPYKSGLTAPQIVAWLEKKMKPPAKALSNVAETKAFVENNEVVTIGFFKDLDSEEALAFKHIAESMDDYAFGIASDKALFEAFNISGEAAIILVKTFDEGRSDFVGNFTSEKRIVQFIRYNAVPLLLDFTAENSKMLKTHFIKSHLLLFLSGSSPDYETHLAEARKIAKDYRGQVLFVNVDADKAASKNLTDFFGISRSDLPTFRLANVELAVIKFKFGNSKLEETNIRGLIEGYMTEGTDVSLVVISQDEPRDWNERPVKVLVGDNFDAVALDTTKDVFVLLHSPSCGEPCRQLEPVWEELAEKLAGNQDIVIAKMDTSKNDAPAAGVYAAELDDPETEMNYVPERRFPSLKLFKAGDNAMEDYTGDFNLHSFIHFIETAHSVLVLN